MTPFQFSADDRADLAIILSGYDVQQTTAALEAVVDAYHRTQALQQQGNAQDDRLRGWLATLATALDRVTRHIDALDVDDGTGFDYSADLHPQGRAAFRAECARIAEAARSEWALRGRRRGPPSRPLILSVGIAKALITAGVPARKSRDSVAGRTFAVVYAALGLSDEGDVFAALQQGTTLATRGIRIRRRKPSN
jgi:hypothetical protein